MLRSRLACALAAGVIYLATPSIANAAPIHYAGNGHWYEYIAQVGDLDYTWQQALTMAAGMTYDPDGPGGNAPLAGYLVTITDAGENAFLDANYGEGYWIAATDEGTEGTWRWVAGPENGQVFWNNGAVPGMYANWNAGEPNNAGPEHFATENLFGQNWNDWSGNNHISFVVEFSERSPSPNVVPEPASLLLLSTGIGGFMMRRRRAARS